MRWEKRGEVWELVGVPNGQAWFSTREGGVSEPPFDRCNLSFNVADRPLAVQENRQRVLAGHGRTVFDLVMAEQVHQDRVQWVDVRHRGFGATDAGSAVGGVDGLLTDDPRVVLGMGFADCVPIFLGDLDGTVAGIVHAGWRGTAAGVQVRAVELLAGRGIRPERIWAGIGPSIGPCCYEVDRPVREAVGERVGNGEAFSESERPGRWQLDLWLANRRILEACGVRAEHIVEARLCTACHPTQFFSHRRDHGRTGRMGGYICLTS